MLSIGDSQNNVQIEQTAPIIRIKQAAKKVDDQHVEILVMGHSDRIMISVTMEGKLGQLVSTR